MFNPSHSMPSFAEVTDHVAHDVASVFCAEERSMKFKRFKQFVVNVFNEEILDYGKEISAVSSLINAMYDDTDDISVDLPKIRNVKAFVAACQQAKLRCELNDYRPLAAWLYARRDKWWSNGFDVDALHSEVVAFYVFEVSA